MAIGSLHKIALAQTLTINVYKFWINTSFMLTFIYLISLATVQTILWLHTQNKYFQSWLPCYSQQTQFPKLATLLFTTKPISKIGYPAIHNNTYFESRLPYYSQQNLFPKLATLLFTTNHISKVGYPDNKTYSSSWLPCCLQKPQAPKLGNPVRATIYVYELAPTGAFLQCNLHFAN